MSGILEHPESEEAHPSSPEQATPPNFASIMMFNYGSLTLESGTLDFLDDVHRRVLEQAVRNILATELAESAYAQILDGLPTEQSLMDSYTFQENDHLVFVINHLEICSGFVERLANSETSSIPRG